MAVLCEIRSSHDSRKEKLSVCRIFTPCLLSSRYKPFSVTRFLCLQGGSVHLYALLLAVCVFRAEVHFCSKNEEGSGTVDMTFYTENEYSRIPRNIGTYVPDQTESCLHILPLPSKSQPNPRTECS
jgi:hypothetical protein